MAKAKKAFFVTGATGFVGNYLAQELQRRYPSYPLFLLARAKGSKSAHERVRDIFPDFHGRVIEGHLTAKEDFDISENDQKHLRGFDVEFWHAAGNISFDEAQSNEIYQANCIGTHRACEFAKKIGAKRFFHISTAYIAGDRSLLDWHQQTVAYEHELDIGQEFNNPYERSKLYAEEIVHEAMRVDNLPATIFRISIAVGHSQTGWTQSFTGYYACVRAFSMLRDCIERNPSAYTKYGVRKDGEFYYMPVRITGKPEATINIASIDYLCDVMLICAERPESVNKTFHITNPQPPQFQWLLKTGLEFLKISGVEIIHEEFPISKLRGYPALETNLERKVNASIAFYKAYIMGEPCFDNRNVRNLLGGVIQHPTIDEHYIQTLLTFAYAHRFGKIETSQFVTS